jgi:hypothetical protein
MNLSPACIGEKKISSRGLGSKRCGSVDREVTLGALMQGPRSYIRLVYNALGPEFSAIRWKTSRSSGKRAPPEAGSGTWCKRPDTHTSKRPRPEKKQKLFTPKGNGDPPPKKKKNLRIRNKGFLSTNGEEKANFMRGRTASAPYLVIQKTS